MSNIYTWQIMSMDVVPSVQNQTNVVCNVNWICSVGNSSTSEIASISDTTSIPYVQQNQFTLFSNLNETQVIDWVKNILGENQVLATYSFLDSLLERKINPSTLTPKLPWKMPNEIKFGE